MLSALRRLCWLTVALFACSDDSGDGGGGAAAGGGGSEPVSFAADIHPILLARCSGPRCHGMPMGPFLPGHAAADSDAAYAATQQEGLNGPVYERILARVSSEDPARMMPPPFAMPPCEGAIGAPGCLTQDELDLLEAWVAQGAPP